ncbi:MAG: hypothetical protein DI616_18220 [Paracoccus denitrificans]|uniref:SPOR domain-containing protein n=1 Tax=Paracoccus denitrificans TaxID=266 RepID=A0A533I4P9_PARDE|nr:MAG: hypothetical protein DI616_18220 [Paracoccus denitrificans]
MRAASIAAVALLLAGCAWNSGHHGSYATVAAPSDAQAMATDSLAELVKLYPPAISRVAIDPAANDDGFGSALADGLRRRGYAVVEASGKRGGDATALPLRYVVDQPTPGFYRVMLTVAGQSLTRGYTIGEAGVAPSAGWALNLSGASPELVERATRPDLPPDAQQVQAELAAVDAGVAPQAALVPAAAPLRASGYREPSNVVSVPVPPSAPSYTAQRAVDARDAEIADADARVRQMAAKVAEYQEADTAVRTMSAKVAKMQGELARAKARRSAAAAGWRVQFAAFRTDRVARQYWRTLTTKRPSLAALTPRFPRSSKGVTFVQAGPYRTVAFARAVCGGLKATACIVVKA